MLHIKKNKSLRGMTLTEVIIAMAIIILVTIAAFIGVNASANFMKHGVDLRSSDGKAAEELENGLAKYNKEGAQVTTYIPYTLNIRELIPDSNGNMMPSADAEETDGMIAAGVVTGSDEKVEYELFVPYMVTEVPENP
ncbi:MAG: hypothetical protein E7505_01205 [Ruminococcus sp.]|nr:hypothetical protein [Ruminococcus sp.]